MLPNANATVYTPNWAPWRHDFWLFLAISSICRGLERFFLPLKHVLKQLFVRVGRFFWADWYENLLATLLEDGGLAKHLDALIRLAGPGGGSILNWGQGHTMCAMISMEERLIINFNCYVMLLCYVVMLFFCNSCIKYKINYVLSI